ncbi:Copper-ion-binding protein [Halalkaliarchaeum sp. AArc-CO]|uniref:heavy metal translocating P-type ATPase n=1 Tax=unclassified Halalkaliarchaeum TaxID=2678344 RepID=UPI00217E8985|nr:MULTISPECIES: heavy metal translocating P-type ATPase [unclassified Halalkaliarchaeum]MDR5673249.1 heavy metal translocating P-type ATPase [Halalkaliarchaeum sp. AArc-GB]UWG51791.1 Copper-ion-binding protein [Halalkaliarchaeum sp. AArc-CO]
MSDSPGASPPSSEDAPVPCRPAPDASDADLSDEFIDSLEACTIRIDPLSGRSCESCALALERKLASADGVYDVSASSRGGVVRIRHDGDAISPEELERLTEEYGATVRDVDASGIDSPGEDPTDVVDGSKLRRETVFVALTFLGMTVGLLGSWLDAAQAVVWGSYGAAYVFGGWYGLKAGIETLRHRAVDIDLLMVIAALGALVVGAPFEGAMLLFLFSLSNVLQGYAIGRSRRAIESLMELRPESATLLRDGKEVTVPIDEVSVGDVFLVRPGDRIPLDGTVESGESAVDQSSLTGESMPVSKEPGEEVYGGTINGDGSLEVRVTREAHESAIARLIHMVEEAQSEKAPTQRLIDRFEQPYVLGVFGLTAAAIAIPLSLGYAFDSTFYRAMTLMVAASPCAVIISTPAAVLSAITAGARRGVLFKGGEHVEVAATIDAVAFDKTGTLTEGNTRLTDATARSGATVDGSPATDDRLLSFAAAVQGRSEHHLARATVEAAEEQDLEIPDARGFKATPGKGVRASVDGETIHIGNARYVASLAGSTEQPVARLENEPIEGIREGTTALESLQADGKTSVLVVRESDDGMSVLGWLAFTDTIRPAAAETIERLRALGIEHVVMLTGDNDRVARHVGEAVGVDEVRSELLPEQKVEHVEELVERHDGVAMVGDGVNDAPALARATLGVGMGGAGTDVALETADVVLMSDDLGGIPYAFGLGRRTRRTLFANFGIAFGAIAIMLVAILTRGIPLPIAVVGHEGSTVLVSLNGLRLLGFRE